MYGTMKTNRFIIAALFLAAAVSCQKDGFVNTEVTRETESAVLVAGEPTKTSLSGKEIHWTNDDVIAVFDKDDVKNKFKIAQDENGNPQVNGSKASFRGLVTAGTTDIYAVYPYNLAMGAEGSILKVNIPQEQTLKVGSFAEEHNISVAKGVKVPGDESVEGVTFRNVCSYLKFTIPPYVNGVTNVTLSTESRNIAGEATVDFSGDIPVLALTESAVNSISMTGTYEVGREFLFVLAPGKIKGCKVTVTDNDGQTWNVVKTSDFTLEAGKYKNLGQLDVEPVGVTASATHIKKGETLIGTDVTLKLNIPAATQKYVTDMSIEVRNIAGELVRSSSNTASTQILAAPEEWPYLPKGTYTVSVSYKLGKDVKNFSSSFTSPAPTFKVTSNAYTSYTKYQTTGASAANAVTGDAICDITSATVAISDDILNNSRYSKGSFTYALDGKPTTSANVENQSWGKHVVTATYTFDGVEISGTTDCHVTGLPYTANPPKNTGDHSWTGEAPTAKINWNGDHVFLQGSSSKQTLTSPTFHVPSDFNVRIKVPVMFYSVCVFGIHARPQLICRISGNEVINRTGAKASSGFSTNKSEDYTANTTGTINTSNPTIQIQNAYTMDAAYIKVYSATLIYE